MIVVNQVSRSFESVKAVDNVSLNIHEGELFGVIGPDGAGKTTLFRMLNSLLTPDAGEISLWGLNPVTDHKAIRRQIGYMPGKFSLYTDLSIEENLQFFATVFGTTVDENYDLIKGVYKDIEPYKKRLAGRLSGGMKQKLALSCALIHKPKLLLLDEPTTGVDAVSRVEFWDNLQRLKGNDITIIVSTPYMDEASLCDRVALMHSGQVHAVDSPLAIVNDFSRKLLTVATDRNYAALKALRLHPECHNVYPFGEKLHFVCRSSKVMAHDLRQFLQNQDIQAQVDEGQANIEDCFIDLTASLTLKLTQHG